MQQSIKYVKLDIYLRYVETYLAKLKKDTKSYSAINYHYKTTISAYSEMSNKEKAKELSTEYLEFFQSIGQQNEILVEAYQIFMKLHVFGTKNPAFRIVIKHYQRSVETVCGKETPEYINALLDEARWISISIDR